MRRVRWTAHKVPLAVRERYDDDPNVRSLKFFGQEILASTYAMANMNVFIHNMEAEIALGDTMNLPKFLDERGGLRKFDIVVSNPMWNQNFQKSTYENDTFGRFTFGFPPSSSADWGWVQHIMLHSRRTEEWQWFSIQAQFLAVPALVALTVSVI